MPAPRAAGIVLLSSKSGALLALRLPSLCALLLTVSGPATAAGQAAARAPAPEADLAPESDDAAARMRARDALDEDLGSPTARAQALVARLEVARRERDRAGLHAAPPLTLAGPTAHAGAGAAGAQGPVADAAWVNLGPTRADQEVNGSVTYFAQDSGRVRNVLPHPLVPGLVYVATAGGGVWKTFDDGAHWDPLTDAVGSLAVGALALDPRNPDILVLGLGDPFDTPQPGLLSSTDGGTTWGPPGGPAIARATYAGLAAPLIAQQVRDLKVSPNDSANILVATDVGLFRWDGSGTPIQLRLPNRAGATDHLAEVWSIAWIGGQTWLVTGREPTVFAGRGTFSTLTLWRSTDDGATWTNALGALPPADAAVPTDPGVGLGRATLAVAPSTTADPARARVYLLAATADGQAQKDLYLSENGGQSFAALGMNSSGVPINPTAYQPTLNLLQQQAFYNQAIGVDPTDPDTLFVGGQFAMARSKDGGRTWAIVSDWLPAAGTQLPYLHADYHAASFTLAGGTKTAYFGTDGGVFRSTDVFTAAPGSARIDDGMNRGLVTHLAYSVACAAETWPADQQGFTFGGLQDNGTRLRSLGSANGPSTFDQVLGGDGVGVAVSRAFGAGHPAVVLGSILPGRIARSVSGGAAGTFSEFMAGLPQANLPPLVRLVSEDAASDQQTFLTFTVAGGAGSPTENAVYRATGAGSAPAFWTSLAGTVRDVNGNTTPGFQNSYGQIAGLRFVATHPTAPGVYGASANGGMEFVTADGGVTWNGAAVLGTNAGRTQKAIRGTSGIAFDPSDPSGRTFWASSTSDQVFDPTLPLSPGNVGPVPDDFGHLFRTTDGGRNWTSVLGTGADLLPNVAIATIKADPGDAGTLYVGTVVGLYQSYLASGGGTTGLPPVFGFRRAPGLPLVKVDDICLAPGTVTGQGNLKIATYGRGFWQLNASSGGLGAGARGRGDLDFNQQLDGFDLIELARLLGTTSQSPAYRQEADLVGATNAVDDEDLRALLPRLGGAP